MATPWIWIAFHAAILVMLAIDLGLLGRRKGAPSMRHAAAWSGVWVAMGLGFGAFVWLRFGATAGTEYVAAYVLEKSLSVDNLFVFAMIFGALGIAPEHRPRILLWGVLGALVMRGIMIAAGVALIERFDWVLYLFGAFLVFTGWKMWTQSHDEAVRSPESGLIARIVGRIIPIDHTDRSGRFVLRRPGRLLSFAGTPLLLALVLVESADLAFALDSIPAVFAVTRDPFIVYTSNVMAVLGLRALYFLLAGMLDRLRYLRYGLAAVLVFIGGKMLVAEWWHPPVAVSLGVIATTIAISVALSWWALPDRKSLGLPRQRAALGARARLVPERRSP